MQRIIPRLDFKFHEYIIALRRGFYVAAVRRPSIIDYRSEPVVQIPVTNMSRCQSFTRPFSVGISPVRPAR